MEFGKSQLLPSYARQPNFKSHESEEMFFEFGCANCKSPIAVENDQLIRQVFSWEQSVGKELAGKAKEFFGIGVVGKAPDGGWPSMVYVQCPTCRTVHLVYAGVEEVSNSAYSVTLQGIVEIIKEA